MSNILNYIVSDELGQFATTPMPKGISKVIEDDIVENTINSLVREAVNHFKKKKVVVKGDFDERYFFTKAEVDLFFKLNVNSQVKLKIVYDDINPSMVSYYELYR